MKHNANSAAQPVIPASVKFVYSVLGGVVGLCFTLEPGGIRPELGYLFGFLVVFFGVFFAERVLTRAVQKDQDDRHE